MKNRAAFMACAYAKYTGKVGACVATSGPGAIHLLNGLYDAKADNTPVIAITGTTYSDLINSNYQQDVNLLELFSGYKLQGKVEAYNKIVKNEFLAVEDISSIDDGKLRYDMFVKAYNETREHGGINGLTPSEMFLQRLIKSKIYAKKSKKV